ncbi:MAG: asparagine synthase (glutamine-hydrolyzing) [Myxococcota bacterium]
MCGVAGYFAKDGLAEGEGRALLERMLEALHHRGPDGRGVFVDRFGGLGSTRLAIIDVAGGRMPIENEDQSVIAVQNGEIYDYRAHRKVLEERGHKLLNHSDSEILPHLYEEHGADLASKIGGMFAIAILDRTRKQIYLARDRMGIKPLFWAFSEDRQLVLFASEAKALLASGRLERKLDLEGLRDVSSAGYPMPPRTMFRGISALPPGHFLRLEEGAAATPIRYYRPPYAGWAEPNEGARALAAPERLEAMAETLRGTFDRVVKDHLIADVEVGSYLSGGLDSVSVAMRAAAQMSAPLHTFAMTFPGKDRGFDESEFSRLAAEHIKSTHREVPQEAISEADYVGTIRAMESPQVHTVGFCLYRLSRAVREAGLKVVLSGEGSDETFAGYGVFKLSKLRRSLLGRASWIRRLAVRVALGRRQPDLVEKLSRWWRLEQDVERRFGLVPPWLEQWWMLSEGFTGVLAPALAEAIGQGVNRLPERPNHFDPAALADPLQRELAFEQASRLDGWVLALGDRLSMAHSIEVRVPFLDPRMLELTARAPSSYLLSRFTEKHLLREAMRGQVPERLRQRQKRAFIAPIVSWLFGADVPAYVRERLSQGARRGLFDNAAIERLFEVLGRGRRDFQMMEASWALNLALGLTTLVEELQLGM